MSILRDGPVIEKSFTDSDISPDSLAFLDDYDPLDPAPSPADRRWAAEILNSFTGDDIQVPYEPGEPVIFFADWLDCEAALMRLQGTECSAWLAGKIAAIADLARHLRAKSPAEFEDRFEVMEDGRDDRLRSEGPRQEGGSR